MMKCTVVVAAISALFAVPSFAALNPGDPAPDFNAPAWLGGNVLTFSLAEALKKGPVVLYFYPAAFTTGCTIEAHDFADAVDAYRALGATVIGVSRDDIDTLNKFPSASAAASSRWPRTKTEAS
jgi:thioredoxin-dependent peroxiredoxin